MTLSVNVQPNKDAKLLVTSHSYEGGANPFVTLDITVPGEGHVAIFLRNVDDARRLVDAAVEAYRNVEALEFDRKIGEITGSFPVFGGNAVTEESYNEWLKGDGESSGC